MDMCLLSLLALSNKHCSLHKVSVYPSSLHENHATRNTTALVCPLVPEDSQEVPGLKPGLSAQPREIHYRVSILHINIQTKNWARKLSQVLDVCLMYLDQSLIKALSSTWLWNHSLYAICIPCIHFNLTLNNSLLRGDIVREKDICRPASQLVKHHPWQVGSRGLNPNPRKW